MGEAEKFGKSLQGSVALSTFFIVVVELVGGNGRGQVSKCQSLSAITQLQPGTFKIYKVALEHDDEGAIDKIHF